MKTKRIKNVFFLVFLLFSYQQTQASELECRGVFSNSTKTIESSPEYQVIQTTLSNLKTFNSRLDHELKNKSSILPAVVLMNFLKREFDSVDEIYRNIIINDLEAILTEYNNSESLIYDVITKFQENLKPSVFKKIFSSAKKIDQDKDDLVNKIIKCRLGLHICATTIGEKTPDFERTYTLVKNLFTVYKNITEHLVSNHQQIIDILSQSEESKSNAIMLFEGKINSLQSQLSVIKIKKDQLEQQYVNAVNIVSLKYPEINNQIKLLISLGAPQKIESGFHDAIENQRNADEINRVALENDLKLQRGQITAAERLKQAELEKIERKNNNISFINNNQKLNLMQIKLEPNNYKHDLDIIEEQIVKADSLTTRDLIYFLSLAQAIKNNKDMDGYYRKNFYQFFGIEPQLSRAQVQRYDKLMRNYNVNFTHLPNAFVYYFEKMLPILLDKWKPDYIRQELELKNELQIMITEMQRIVAHDKPIADLIDKVLAKKTKELTEKVNGVKYEK